MAREVTDTRAVEVSATVGEKAEVHKSLEVSSASAQQLTAEIKEVKTQLVTVTGEELGLTDGLGIVKVESDRRSEELFALKGASTRVKCLMRSFAGCSVKEQNAYIT